MKWFYNLKIRVKMLLSFSIVIVLLAAMAVFATVQIREVDRLNTYATQYPGAREYALLEFQSSVYDLRRIVSAMTMYAPLREEARVAPLVGEATAALNRSAEALDRYARLIAADPEFTQADKDARIAKVNELKGIMDRYNTDVRIATEIPALAGEYEPAVEAAMQGAGVVVKLGDLTDELLVVAAKAAAEADSEATAMADRAVMLIIILAIVAAAASLALAIFIAQVISKPLVLLSTFMKRAGTTGELTISPVDAECIGKNSGYVDELGHVISGSASFINHVKNTAMALETVANGDMTAEIEVLSEADILGVSLKKMTGNLGIMFAEVQSSAGQVSAGSKQIAEGAQSLAQGATEQAASIRELSDSISEIAGKTKENARTADVAAKLSLTIKENAEKGSLQMDQMIAAVDEINDASVSISKIIKTIDDIAFQTNILALNAAVEAARAGQHGKGFAVVAEEVRNLASKSAEAAKDTGTMIQNSMEKAGLGSRIAEETASSLKEIVSGINESSSLIAGIASSSEEQSQGIAHINSGIEQVAHVVQLNSATAQESAAASQEMSGQSDVLQQLISQFMIAENEEKYRALRSNPAGFPQESYAGYGDEEYDSTGHDWSPVGARETPRLVRKGSSQRI